MEFRTLVSALELCSGRAPTDSRGRVRGFRCEGRSHRPWRAVIVLKVPNRTCGAPRGVWTTRHDSRQLPRIGVSLYDTIISLAETNPGGLVILANEDLQVEVDLDCGAEVTSLRYLPADAELLATTPWARHADDVRSGRARYVTSSPQERWLEEYRGGWQIVFPTIGPDLPGGAARNYHGEATRARWQLAHSERGLLEASTSLFTAPLQIRRSFQLRGRAITVSDRIHNEGATSLLLDYCSHSAFNIDVFGTGSVVSTNAGSFASAGSAAVPRDGSASWATDQLSPDERAYTQFGSFSDFGEPEAWVTLTSIDKTFLMTTRWTSRELPHAWVWHVLPGESVFPWFGRGGCLAIEPCNRSPDLATPSKLIITPGEELLLKHSIEVDRTDNTMEKD